MPYQKAVGSPMTALLIWDTEGQIQSSRKMRPGDWGARASGLKGLGSRETFFSGGGGQFSILGSFMRKADINPTENKMKMLLTSEPCLMMNK